MPLGAEEFPLAGAVCIVPQRLYVRTQPTGSSMPSSTDGVEFFSIDDKLTYTPFFADFGPLNLGQVRLSAPSS